MKRNEKSELVEQLNKEWSVARTAFLVEFRGITVPQVTEFRHKVRDAKGRYRVVKNTLAARAMKETPLDGLSGDLGGPLGIAYTADDSVALAKVLADFAKDHPNLVMKSGVLDGQRISGTEVSRVAAMPGKRELVGQLVGLVGSPLRRLVTALNSPLAKFVNVLDQVRQQKEKADTAS